MGIYLRLKILREFEEMDWGNLQDENDNKFIALSSDKRTIWYTITA